MEPIVHPGGRVEEVIFSLTALATRDGPDCDGFDWVGSSLPNFSETRVFGQPLLDLAILAPGNAQVRIQYAIAAVVDAEPPALTYTTGPVFAGVGANWLTIQGFRITPRFWRVQVADTSNAANNGIYLVYWIRGN